MKCLFDVNTCSSISISIAVQNVCIVTSSDNRLKETAL